MSGNCLPSTTSPETEDFLGAIRPPGQLDERDERHRALLLLTVPHHRNVRLANRQRPSCFDHMAARDQQRPIPWSQQVEFELNSEDISICIQQSSRKTRRAFPPKNFAWISSGNFIASTCWTHFSQDSCGKLVPKSTLSFP